MPWNTQDGGGPWGGGGGGSGGGGSGGGGPWGQRPRGPGRQPPPNIEEMLKKSQDRVRRFMPSGFGGFKGILLIILLAIAGWAATGFYRVQPDEVGVVLRFGNYVRTTGPGLHYHLPSPIESVALPTVTRNERIVVGMQSFGNSNRVQDVPEESLMLTGDENIVDIDFVVLYKIGTAASDPVNYLYNVRRPRETVKVAAESVMREIIGRVPIQRALTEGRQEIQSQAREELQQLMDEYETGVQILQVQLQQVDPPAQVVDAFNDVQRAKQDKERLRNEADAYRNDIVPRARGDAEKIIQGAKAYEEEVVARAQGDAQRFDAVYQSYTRSTEVTTQRIYIETMEEVLRNVNKVLIDGKAGNGVVPYLPLPEIQKRAAQPVATDPAAGRKGNGQ